MKPNGLHRCKTSNKLHVLHQTFNVTSLSSFIRSSDTFLFTKRVIRDKIVSLNILVDFLADRAKLAVLYT